MRAVLLLLAALAALWALLQEGPPPATGVRFAEHRNSTVLYSSHDAPADLLAHGGGHRPKMVALAPGATGEAVDRGRLAHDPGVSRARSDPPNNVSSQW